MTYESFHRQGPSLHVIAVGATSEDLPGLLARASLFILRTPEAKDDQAFVVVNAMERSPVRKQRQQSQLTVFISFVLYSTLLAKALQ